MLFRSHAVLTHGVGAFGPSIQVAIRSLLDRVDQNLTKLTLLGRFGFNDDRSVFGGSFEPLAWLRSVFHALAPASRGKAWLSVGSLGLGAESQSNATRWRAWVGAKTKKMQPFPTNLCVQ